jgi:hypothetical protein
VYGGMGVLALSTSKWERRARCGASGGGTVSVSRSEKEVFSRFYDQDIAPVLPCFVLVCVQLRGCWRNLCLREVAWWALRAVIGGSSAQSVFVYKKEGTA